MDQSSCCHNIQSNKSKSPMAPPALLGAGGCLGLALLRTSLANSSIAVVPATTRSRWETRLSSCGRKLFLAALHCLILTQHGLCPIWEWETDSSGDAAPDLQKWQTLCGPYWCWCQRL